MKTKEEILIKLGITEKTKFHNYNYLYKAILKAMQEYGEQINKS